MKKCVQINSQDRAPTQNEGFNTPHIHSPRSVHFQPAHSAHLTDIQFLTPPNYSEDGSLKKASSNSKMAKCQVNEIKHHEANYNILNTHYNISHHCPAWQEQSQQHNSLLSDVIKICDGIYIGMSTSLQDPDLFYSNYITHVVLVNRPSASSIEKIPIISHKLCYQIVDSIQDNVQERKYVKNELVNYIQEAKNQGESVLIVQPSFKDGSGYRLRELVSGLLNSALVATEYLMLRYCWSLFKGLQFVNCRISAIYRSANILKQLQNRKEAELSPPIVHPHPHLKSTEILLLKSNRKVSYSWDNCLAQTKSDREDDLHQADEQLILINTYLNSGKGKGIYLSYQEIMNTAREKSARNSRKNSPKRPQHKQETNQLSLLLKSKMRTSTQSHQTLINPKIDNIFQQDKTIKKNNSVSLIKMSNTERNNQRASKIQQLKPIIKNHAVNAQVQNIPEAQKIKPIKPTQPKTKTYSLELNLKRNIKTSRQTSRRNSSEKVSENQEQNNQVKQEKKTRRVQWPQKLVITDEGITRKFSERTIQNNGNLEPKPQAAQSKQKIILSVMELVGKKFLQKQQIRTQNRKPQKVVTPKQPTRTLNKSTKLVKSKIRLQTMNDFTNTYLNSLNTITSENNEQKQEKEKKILSDREIGELGKKMATMPDVLDDDERVGYSDRNGTKCYKNQSGTQTLNTSMIGSISNLPNQGKEASYNHQQLYCKTQNYTYTESSPSKQNIVALTIQKLKQLKQTSNQKGPSSNFLKKQPDKSKKKLTILI